MASQMEPAAESVPPPGGVERRAGKADLWTRVLRVLGVLVYPIMIINLFIILGMGTEYQAQVMEQRGEGPAQQLSGWLYMKAFVPVMIAGMAVGAIGLVLDRKRARRRTDKRTNLQYWFILLSAAALVLYFLILTSIPRP